MLFAFVAYDSAMGELLVFLGSAIVISLSGVMAPGSLTAATISAGTRRRHAGALVAIGHAVVEWPLAVLIVLGVGDLLKRPDVKAGIGLAGGLFLLFMGVGMLRSIRKLTDPDGATASPARHPMITGIILSGSNPYFLLWWATVGLALATQAADMGVMAFIVFVVIHWLLDLIWLEILSQAAHRGTRAVSPKAQQVVLGICGAALLFFGGKFLIDAGFSLHQLTIAN